LTWWLAYQWAGSLPPSFFGVGSFSFLLFFGVPSPVAASLCQADVKVKTIVNMSASTTEED
jgi:hypothetical protein